MKRSAFALLVAMSLLTPIAVSAQEEQEPGRWAEVARLLAEAEASDDAMEIRLDADGRVWIRPGPEFENMFTTGVAGTPSSAVGSVGMPSSAPPWFVEAASDAIYQALVNTVEVIRNFPLPTGVRISGGSISIPSATVHFEFTDSSANP